MSGSDENEFLLLEDSAEHKDLKLIKQENITKYNDIGKDENEDKKFELAKSLGYLSNIFFKLSIFCGICFVVYFYNNYENPLYFETSYRYYFYIAIIIFPLSPILYITSLVVDSNNSKILREVNDNHTKKIEHGGIDSGLSNSLGGVWRIGWEVFGIDCPDCALKITKSLNSLKGIQNTSVSITTGLVEFDIDIEIQNLSKINTVLCDLGYAPNTKWWEISDISSKDIISRLSTNGNNLIKILNHQPGVIESRVEADIIFIRLPTKVNSQIVKEFQKSISELFGQKIELKERGGEWGLRPDQRQLLEGIVGLFFLPVIFLLQFLQEQNVDLNSVKSHLLYLIALPAIIFSSRQLRIKSLESLKQSQLGFEVLISMAVFGAVLLQAWFEALLIVVLIALANNLENSAIRKARESMQGGLNRIPNEARIVGKNVSKIVNINQIKIGLESDKFLTKKESKNKVPVGLVNVGDRVEVRTGEIIPVDGFILSGSGLVDKSALTGESLPQKLSKGDFVEAGLVLTKGPVIIETSSTGENTRLNELINTTKKYQEAPTRIHSMLEIFTNVWVPLVLFGSIFIALIIPETVIGDNDRLRIVLLLWVTACPCALLICSPIPHAISISMASNKGIIAKGGDVLEKIAKVNLALLDKTGTLTAGKPQVTEIFLTKGTRIKTVLGISAGLELSSNHPYASAIIDKCEGEKITPYLINDLSDENGGIRGTYNKENVAIGNKQWIEEQGIAIPNELIGKLDASELTGISILAKGDNAVAVFGFNSDSLNPNSTILIKNLNNLDIKVELLSGDNQKSVDKTANDLGIPVNICKGGLSPEEKVDWIEKRSNTHFTLMAGDGFNDAAAMAKADVGISVGNKEQINLDAADVMIPSERPDLIASLCELSRKTKSVVIQNLILSISLSLILVISVISGNNNQIWINVLAHEFSVLLVILNAMKLSSYKFPDKNFVHTQEVNYNPILILIKIVKDSYEDSKQVLQIIFNKTL